MDWKARVRAALASAPRIPDDAAGTERERVEAASRGAAFAEASAPKAGGPGVPDEEVVEELAQHARAEYDAARADGCTHQEADVRVTDLLTRWRSDASVLRHRSRRPPVVEPPAADKASWFAGLGRDITYAARLLRRQPRYAVVAILTMALGIGATTLLFSVTYGVLMEPLPWPGADRIVVLKETRGGNPPRFGTFTNAAYLAWSQQSSTVEALAAWSQRTVTLTGAGEPDRIRITTASASLFAVLAARPIIGSFFEQKDEASPVVVLSESLWRQRFGADPAVLGRLVHFDGEPHTVIGVLPERMAYPDQQSRAWVPFQVRPATGNYLSMFQAIATLRPGATATQAAAEGTARGRFAADTGMTTMAIFGGKGPVEISAQPLRDALTVDVRRPLIVLLVAVGLLLFTATANVASLQLARATTRQREMALRAALGAGNVRVTRQLLVESLLVSLAGGAVGLAFAWTLHRFVPSILPADFPRVDDLRINGVVVSFALLIAVVTGVVFGLLPALRLRKLNLVTSLTEDGTAPVGAGGRSLTSRARMLIMAAQVAIACVLLIGAALLGRSFLVLLATDRGFDPSGVLTARLALPAATYTAEQRHAILEQILDRMTTTPGVTAAAFTSEQPLGPGGSTSAFTMRTRTDEGGTVTVQASPRIVSARYFTALGMRIVAGRGFSEADTESAPPVVVVNRAFAKRFLGDTPLGARMPMGVGYEEVKREATVVGVLDDIRYVTASDSSQPEIYYSYRQFGGRLAVPVVTLMLRTTDDPFALARPLRTAVREADSTLVAEGILTMEDRMLRGLARPRLYAIVLGGFAASALLVAAVGLFGVLSYTVAQRSRELAVRTALGARRIDVVRLVFGQTMKVTAAGIAAGVLVSLVVTRSIAALLHGVTPHDGVTYVVVPLVLFAVAAAACLPPAIRAAKLDPLRALRS